jgi:hypothetical protein
MKKAVLILTTATLAAACNPSPTAVNPAQTPAAQNQPAPVVSLPPTSPAATSAAAQPLPIAKPKTGQLTPPPIKLNTPPPAPLPAPAPAQTSTASPETTSPSSTPPAATTTPMTVTLEPLNITVQADDNNAMPSTITAAKGQRVNLTFKVSSANVYYGGLDFRSDSITTGTILSGQSKTVSFTASTSFSFTPYWPASGVAKGYKIHITVQ